MKKQPRQIEWICQLLEWYGLYQHPQAKDKNCWYVHPEHAVAGADNEAINEWCFCGNNPSYTTSVIKSIIEDEQQIPHDEKVIKVCCFYECSNFLRAEDGETCLMFLGAEQGPTIEGYGGLSVEYVGEFDVKTHEYVWRPRTAIDEALVRKYFHHIPTQRELNYMCQEGCVFRLDDLPG